MKCRFNLFNFFFNFSFIYKSNFNSIFTTKKGFIISFKKTDFCRLSFYKTKLQKKKTRKNQ